MKIMSLTLTLLFGLIFGFKAFGDVIAYRLAWDWQTIVFTDNPFDFNDSNNGPLGMAFVDNSPTNKCSSSAGGAGVQGLVCTGTPGDPVSNYTCAVQSVQPPAGEPFWCLFSENPRTGNKAWAVEVSFGIIAAGAGSVVLCEGADIFDSANGCNAPAPASVISIKGGYFQLDTTNGSPPQNAHCSQAEHEGRMIVDDTNGDLYICIDTGWVIK